MKQVSGKGFEEYEEDKSPDSQPGLPEGAGRGGIMK